MAKTTNERLGDLIRRLASNHDGEVVATVHALQRTLISAGRDLHQLAGVVEKNGGLSEAEAQRLFDNGFRAGLKQGRHVANVDDDEDYYAMAQFVWERADRLHRRHRGFAEGMVKLAGESELSVKQKVYLQSLYRQLGGR